MKKLFFYSLDFIRHDKNAPGEGRYRRILAGNKVFYTYSTQFSDSNVVDTLTAGERVHIGAHQLADGSYWLHWLVCPGKGVLQPAIANVSKPALLFKLLCAAALLALSAYGYFWLLNIWTMLVFLLIFCGTCYWFISSLHALMAGSNAKMRRLLQVFGRVERGDYSDCLAPQENLPVVPGGGLPSTGAAPANDFEALCESDFQQSDRVSLVSLRADITEVHAKRGFSGSGKSRRDFIDYQLTVNNARFQLRTGLNTLLDDLNPLFFRTRPLFLAPGDNVTLVIDQQNDAILGVCNERDGSAYQKLGMGVSFQQLKLMYKVVLACCLFLLAMMACFTLHDWWQQGWALDKWDWLDAAELFYTVALMGMAFFCGCMLLIEICFWLVRRYSLNGARFAFVRHMLILFKRRRGQNEYVQEVA